MKNILVLYRSKYGAAKKYAEMIKETLSCDMFAMESFPIHDAVHYEIIIVTGGIYASGISAMKYIRKHIAAFTNKKVVVFAVGASPFDADAWEAVKEHNQKNIPFEIPMFYGRGAYDESIMDMKDRTLCRLLKKTLRKKDPSTFEPWMQALFETEGKPGFWIEKSYLEPLFQYIETIGFSLHA